LGRLRKRPRRSNAATQNRCSEVSRNGAPQVGPPSPIHNRVWCTANRRTRLRFSRALSPEGCQRARERGRQTTAILVTSPAAFRRPRRCAAVSRVQAHRQRPSDPTLWRSTPGCCVRDRKATALVVIERRCRRASVRAVAGGAQPRSATPDLKRTSWSSRHACERKYSRGLVRVTVPAPHQTLSCYVP
jgi:hypothetical protein